MDRSRFPSRPFLKKYSAARSRTGMSVTMQRRTRSVTLSISSLTRENGSGRGGGRGGGSAGVVLGAVPRAVLCYGLECSERPGHACYR